SSSTPASPWRPITPIGKPATGVPSNAGPKSAAHPSIPEPSRIPSFPPERDGIPVLQPSASPRPGPPTSPALARWGGCLHGSFSFSYQRISAFILGKPGLWFFFCFPDHARLRRLLAFALVPSNYQSLAIL